MNDEGQCGHGHEVTVMYPMEVEFPDKYTSDEHSYVVSVSCGHSHTGEKSHVVVFIIL